MEGVPLQIRDQSADCFRAEFGVLHSFAYMLEDASEEIVVSTTRPETIPADRAIAVHPDDERYKVRKHTYHKFS